MNDFIITNGELFWVNVDFKLAEMFGGKLEFEYIEELNEFYKTDLITEEIIKEAKRFATNLGYKCD
jgi:hypothetical protein